MRESLVLLSATFVTLNKANLPSVTLMSFNDVHFSRFSRRKFFEIIGVPTYLIVKNVSFKFLYQRIFTKRSDFIH